MSKPKSIDFGTVRKGSKGPFFTFDPSIKSIKITREYVSKGETVTQVLEVPINDKGYLEAAFIDKTEDYFNNKVNRGWMDADKAEKAKNALLEKGVSSIFQVKVN